MSICKILFIIDINKKIKYVSIFESKKDLKNKGNHMLSSISPKSYFPIASKKWICGGNNTTVFFDQKRSPDMSAPINSITRGDAHGHLMTIMQFLLEFSAVVIDYPNLAKIQEIFAQTDKIEQSNFGYRVSRFSQKQYLELERIISKNLFIINNNVTYRLLGDLLNDRRGNTYLTLSFFYLLNKYHPDLKLELIWSNHDLDFFKNFNSYFPFSTAVSIQSTDRQVHEFLVNDKDRSLFECLINDMVAFYYRSLKLVSYSSKDKTLYTHAPVNRHALGHFVIEFQKLIPDEIHEDDFICILNGNITPDRFEFIATKINAFMNSKSFQDIRSQVLSTISDFVWFRNTTNQMNDIFIGLERIIHVHGHDGGCTSERQSLAYGKVCLDTLYYKIRDSEYQYPFNDAYISFNGGEGVVSEENSDDEDDFSEYEEIFSCFKSVSTDGPLLLVPPGDLDSDFAVNLDEHTFADADAIDS